ncbi:MAG: site-specific integrase [Polyangiaceae bacterium]|jgi:site-specific recombinase XerD|nr:site-specific integrase [Polyangiaceae bacterium]
MLERFYVRPQTIDRIRASWIGPAIEKLVAWMVEQNYATRMFYRRLPTALQFGDFAKERGATSWNELPAHVDAFVAAYVREHGRGRAGAARTRRLTECARTPVEHMLRLVVPGFVGAGRPRDTSLPFADELPGFFDYLRTERGINDAGRRTFRAYLRGFEAYLRSVGVAHLRDVSPPVLHDFVVHRRAQGVALSTVGAACRAVRGLLRYAHRERVVPRDLSGALEAPLAYRLADVPRAIPWDDVTRVLAQIDRRSPTGKRDYAVALLLVTYGLRAGEVAALTLDDLDWKHERLRIPSRKAGNAGAFPLSAAVGAALADYLQHGRPATPHRRVFLRAVAPPAPLTAHGITSRAVFWLRRAGVDVVRPGAHTFRHTCLQRLVDARLPLETVRGYAGHRSPASTGVYAKVAVEALREVALGDGEAAL